MNRRLAIFAVSSGLTMIVLAACNAAGSGGAVPGGSGSAGPVARSMPPTLPSEPPAPAPGRCGGPLSITVDAAHPPAPVCLRVGEKLQIVAGASPRQPWQAVASSDPAVVTCASTRGTDGAVSAVCHALRPGAAVLRTGTEPFAGDPHGPPQQSWELSITVEG